MNWEAAGAIGEILAAIAVVATLLYLSRELRQNLRSQSITTLRDTTAQWNHWGEMIATSPDLADIVVKGNSSYETLTESESLRYGAYIQSFFDIVESHRALVVDPELDTDLAVLTSIVSRRLKILGFMAWWGCNQGDYAKEFVDWIEALKPASQPP
jgi:hypothetical protein